MPGIHLFGHRFNFSSDDLTIPSLIDIIVRFPLIFINVFFHFHDQSSLNCQCSFIYFYPLMIISVMITIVCLIICYISLQGSPVNNKYPRRYMSLFISIRFIFVIIDIGINLLGLIEIIRVFNQCEDFLCGILLLSIILSGLLSISLFFILMIFIDLSSLISSEKKWKMRIRLLFCCGTNDDVQSSDIENIVQTLKYLFDDQRFDLVPSDLATGLVLLQEEDFFQERQIHNMENVTLEILQQGLYYNSYAQSAFGWFSLAYQYRMTFIPRILFAMRFRTIGFCCCGCCGLPCCQNPDSLDDPCGSQYRTLQYLLRKQKPIILYANFLGAFGRAPFYIAADNEKKSIIISIRGTLSASDILTDINVVEDIFETDLFGNGYCHSGMHSAAKYIRDDISTRLTNIFCKYNDYSLVICGYSLGAGIAVILSILFKSNYPHLKCYGIAMPGAVLSENLILSTRHFIYSYVVDVDIIARASLHSLEHLRDRLILALNQCNRNKFNVLTKTFIETLTKRRQIFQSMNNNSNSTYLSLNINSTISQIVSTNQMTNERVDLLLPGTIIHLYSIDPVRIFTRKTSYRACISTYQQFKQVIVHPRMWLDHFPASYSTALADAIEHFQNSSII